MEPAPGADTNSVVKPDKMGIDHVEHGTAGELTEQDLYRLSSRKLSLPISQLSADEIEVELHHRHGTLFTASAHVITAIIGAGVQRLRCPGPLGGPLVLGANCMEASLTVCCAAVAGVLGLPSALAWLGWPAGVFCICGEPNYAVHTRVAFRLASQLACRMPAACQRCVRHSLLRTPRSFSRWSCSLFLCYHAGQHAADQDI